MSQAGWLRVLCLGLQDFFDAEEGNRESFDYNKPSRSTANPLYGRDGKPHYCQSKVQ